MAFKPVFIALSLLVFLCHSVPAFSQTCNNLTISRKPGRCIWFGACADSPLGVGAKYNCFDNNPARNASSQGSEFFQLLQDTCPKYAESGKVCCDIAQLQALATQIKYPQQLFSRCPACLENFMDHFCRTTCDPDQAMYMDPTQCTDGKTKDGVNNTAITDINIYITSNYAEGLYNSCSNVQYPQASNRVVDLMCGGSDFCNSSLWLSYLGDPGQNHNSPFPMRYLIGKKSLNSPPKNVTPTDNNFIRCDTNDTKYRCSCADCDTPVVCPAPPLAPNGTFPKSIIMFSIAGVGISLSLTVFTIALAVGIMVFLSNMRSSGYGPIGSTCKSGYGTLDNDGSPSSSVGSINAEDVDLRDVAVKPPQTTICLPCYISGAHIENWIKIVFYHWGCFVANFWYMVIPVGVGSVLCLGALSLILHTQAVLPFLITTDPVQLWSSPTSRARLEKNYFDENFNPFYRTEMMIITAKEPNYYSFQPIGVDVESWTFGPVLERNVLEEVYYIQDHLIHMVAEGTLDNGTEVNVTLNDICFKPLSPDNENCTVMSVLNYFQNDYTNLMHEDTFTNINASYHIYYCTRNPTATDSSFYDEIDIPCLGAFGGPVDPNIILGGFNILPNGANNYNNATALIVSFTVNNHLDNKDNEMAKIWEKAYLDYITNYTGVHINISYSAERSIEDELSRESKTDVFTVALSYVLMFVYITIFLGHIRKPVTVLIDMKIVVGLLGVLMVLLAVIGSMCLLNLFRVPATLIIIEVVPFLVLAVGVDNLFIIVHSYERELCKYANARDGDVTNVPTKELIGRAIAEVAPSLLLTSLSETAAFLLGGVSTMPAVRTFSFYAGVAVFFNFLLQISVFLAALSVDVRRQVSNRLDIFCFIKIKGIFDPRKGLDVMHTIMNAFASLILYPIVRPFILLGFGLTFTASLALMFKLQIGLDQTVALPKDSYLNNYFGDLYEYLHTGSPVYFVIKEGFNYSNPEYQAKFCSASGCEKESIGTQIFGYSRNSKLTGIAEPAMLWMDTYFEWIAPRSQCCGITLVDDKEELCHYPQYNNDTCRPCVTNETENGWPEPDDFDKYVHWFLQDNPGKRCPSGGHAAFAGGVKFYPDQDNVTQNNTIKTSYVMTYHSIMSNSSSFISGLKWARKLGEQLTKYIGVEVFPYSVFYVYYEQYLTTIHDMALNIGLSIGAVFSVTFILMGLNLWAALIVMLIVVMIIVHMIGCMAIAGISANAVSLVNLVMTVGISVEFCSHIVRWFCSCSEPSRHARAHSALAHMGASVVSGITLTKLIGVFVLFFSKSQIFEIYYFRMYMFMLLWGALHGLVFLPVLLSYIGPSYVPVKVILPYNDDVLEQVGAPSAYVASGKGHRSTSTTSSAIPKSPSKNADNNVQYPSLPNVDSYQPPGVQSNSSQQQQQQQQYPGVTYPGQNLYQQKGEVYQHQQQQQPNERSNLIHS